MNAARRSPTLKDIAARVGVSESAASLALAGKPGVSEKTRRAVLQVAEELDWTPNHAARVLSGSRSETIGLVFARDVEDVGSEAFFLQFLTGLQEVLSAKDYGLLMQAVESVEEEIAVYRKWRRANRVDAVVLIDLRNDDTRPQALHEMGLPTIIAGGSDPRGLVPEIVTCDKEAMRLILEFLGTHHHERIAYICGDDNLAHISKRIEEFRSGVSEELRTVFPTDFSAAAGARATEEALRSHPTAIIFDNEVLAMSGLAAIRRGGKRVPDDVSVFVWEEPAVAELVDPALTTLSRDAFELGERAAGALLDYLDGKPIDEDTPVPPTLVVRDSVSDAPARLT